MAISYLPLLISIIGALVYALSSNGKAAELGRIAFSCGLLVTLMTMAHHIVRMG
jgi:hypothetical protein